MNLITVHPYRRAVKRPVAPTADFDKLFNEFFNGSISKPQKKYNTNFPAANVIENNDNFRIEMAVPGLTKKDIGIEVDNDLLTVSANKETSQKEGEKFTRKEFNFDNFKRTFQLPESVNASKIEAAFKNGILEIILAKKEEAKIQPPRAIAIK